MQNVELKAGELIVFSSGEYSSYGYDGHFVALRDVSNDEMLELVSALKAEESSDPDELYGHARDSFIARAIQQGWLLSVNCREIHYGSYGELNLS